MAQQTTSSTLNDLIPVLEVCYQCGTCTGSCPITRFNPEKNPRKLINQLITTGDPSILDDQELLWLCTTCYQCEDRCPQGIPLADIFVKLKNLTVKEGKVPPSVRKEIEAIAKSGYTFPITRGILSKRERLGLPIPPSPNMTEIRTIVKLTTDFDVNGLKDTEEKEESKFQNVEIDIPDGDKGFALFLGCTIPYKLPQIEAAARFILDKLEIPVYDLPFGCCPDPNGAHSYNSTMWYALAARNLAIAEEKGLDILTLCNGCYETLNYVNQKLKHEPQLLKEVNKYLKEAGKQYKGKNKVIHLHEFLHEEIGYKRLKQLVTRPLEALKISVHYGCHSLRPKKINPPEDPENPQWLWDFVEEVLGAQPTHYMDEALCCGAGVRDINQDTSFNLMAYKVEQMERMEANAIMTPCPTCFLQFDAGQKIVLKNKDAKIKGLPTFYFVELLALAMGADPKQIGINLHLIKPKLNL